MRYFREKLNRRNVTVDVKYYEDCEQFFMSVGRCFVVEALLEFFHMSDTQQKPKKNGPNMAFMTTDEQKKLFIESTLDKFLEQYVFIEDDQAFGTDSVCHYSVNLVKSFMILADIKDAVATGNGQHLSVLHKQLLVHFFSASGFNEYAIEMLVNIMQHQILLSPAQAHQCMWAATVNWSGGYGKNVEIDLFQENRNKDMKAMIKSMGANKSEKAIHRASKAAGGVRQIVDSFEKQVSMPRKSSSHSHKSSSQDEKIVVTDLRSLRPFHQVNERKLESFKNISYDPTSSFDEKKFVGWINNHKHNMLLHFPSEENDNEDDISEDEN